MKKADSDASLAPRPVIVGTAGHVDHGKTTLIRALTGMDPDRLAEEKARGMTIDLGFAFLTLPSPTPNEPPLELGIVDVPGHERFVKNMLAGAGGVDVALVVVAADEGPMPQTREHLDILTSLGVRHGVVALTKIDRADDPELQEIALLTTREALENTSLQDAPLVPVSAETGENLEALRQALARACAEAPARSAIAPFRLPVDRVFSLPGVGTVVTGTLVAGTLRAGDAVTIEPQGVATRVRTLQTHNQRIDAALPGMRVAINLPGVETGQVERGAVLSAPGSLSATTLFDARLDLLPNAPRPVRHRERIRLHLGAGEILARVLLLSGSAIAPGASDVPVQLLCENLAAPARGERFVIRTYSPSRAVGGGTVDNSQPSRRYRRGDAQALAVFAARQQGGSVESVYAALASRNSDFSPEEIAQASGLPLTEVTGALADLAAAYRAASLPDGRYLSDRALTRLSETARRTLATYHRQNPLRRAMARDNLRTPLSKAATVRDFGAALSLLAERGELVFEGTWGLRLPFHEVVLPPHWRQAADEMRAVYIGAGLTPPDPGNFQANFPRDVHVPAILNVLTDSGDLIRLGDDVFLARETIDSVKEVLRRLAQTPEGITVATLRDATGSSRKIILPLLEYLDAQKITRRLGDTRRELVG